MKTSETFHDREVTELALRFYESLGTPFALSLAVKLRSGDWDGLVADGPDPRNYDNADSFGRDWAAFGLLKKHEPLPTSHDKKARALEKWWQAEKQCCQTNMRLEPYLPNSLFQDEREEAWTDLISRTRKIIRGWIGLKPPDLLEGSFGPGATVSNKARRSTVPDKISTRPSMTSDAVWFLPQWLSTLWGISSCERHSEGPLVTRGNSLSYVPKDATIYRTTSPEPDVNVFYQLAVGRYLKRCLHRRAKWDLRIAKEIHMQVACESSVTREFATLDLSSASDTLAKVLVKILMPTVWDSVLQEWRQPWLDTLESLRSPMTHVNGKWVRLEKFSSMGNGFTFELETIIFAALACAVSQLHGHLGLLGVDTFVFGDDIIVKDGVAPTLKSVLQFFGFSLNDKKSFWGNVPFRESCGGDYFAGKPVRPYFLKDSCDGPEDWIAAANGVRACLERLDPSGHSLSRRPWFYCLDRIPSGIRSCRGPSGLGDLVIHDVPARWNTRTRSSIRYIRCWRPARRRHVSFGHFHPSVVLACATYGTGNLGTPKAIVPWDGVEPFPKDDVRLRAPAIEGVTPRDAVISYKVGWIPFS